MKKSFFLALAAAAMMAMGACGNSDNKAEEAAAEAENADPTVENIEVNTILPTDTVVAEAPAAKEAPAAVDQTAEAAPAATAKAANAPKGVIDLEGDNLDAYLGKGYEVVLDFTATWCVPCRKLKPVFHDAAEKYAGKVAFISVDIDKNPGLKEAYEATAVPKVVFISPNGQKHEYTGIGDLLPAEKFNALVEKYK